MKLPDLNTIKKMVLVLICAIIILIIAAAVGIKIASNTTIADFAADEEAKSEASGQIHNLLE